MSFWRSLFGGGARGEAAGRAAEPVEYKGFVIRAAPFKEGGKWLTAGTIEKEIAGARKTHRFVRADSHASFDQAASFSVDKARQIIDLMGDRLFD